MPRIRSLKPEHKQHRKVGQLTDFQYRLWIGLITEADDAGRLVASPAQLRVLVFGYQPRVTAARVQEALETIARAGLAVLYHDLERDVQYAALPSFRDHQVINKPSTSRLPPPPFNSAENKDDGSATVGIRERSRRTTDGSDRKDRKDQGSEGSTSPAIVDKFGDTPDNGHGRPQRGRYQDILARIKANHPELSQSDAEVEALRQLPTREP